MVLIRGARVLTPLLLSALLSTGCGSKAPVPTRTAPPPTATALVVDTVTVSLPLSFPAQLYVEHDAVVSARSSGSIDSLFVDIGSRVTAGQLLAQIENVDQTLDVARAEAAREQSERTLARARALSESRGMSVAESEQIEFAYREAVLEVRRAQRELELTRITAPFAGLVTARYVRPRRLVVAGDTLFRIAESEPLLARIRVPETVALSLHPGTSVQVGVGIAAAVPGTVFMVAPVIDPGSGTREVILRLARAGGLLPGAAVTVRLGSERRLVLAVSRDALGIDGYVLVSDGDRTTLRTVVLGSDLGDGRVEVISGLRAGERLARPGR